MQAMPVASSCVNPDRPDELMSDLGPDGKKRRMLVFQIEKDGELDFDILERDIA
jgi:hypothetical protein